MEEYHQNNLAKGEIISLTGEDSNPATRIFIGCSWGAVKESTLWGLFRYTKDVDLDLSCVMFNRNGNIIDHIYSPLYIESILRQFGLPKGKTMSSDKAIMHTGDDINGDRSDEDEEVDNEILLFNLEEINPDVEQIFIFLNNCGKEDFAEIPYVRIRLVEGTPENRGEEIARFSINTEAANSGKTAVILGKIFRDNETWNFQAIGDATPDPFLGHTIHRIASGYASKKL